MVGPASRLPADPAHGPRRGAEARLVDVMLQLLAPHGVADDPLQLSVVRAGAQRVAQVGLVAGEEAGAKLSVAGQADPVAVGAERLRDRVNEADLARAVGKPEHPRSGRGLAGQLLQPVSGLDDLPDLPAGQDGVGGPCSI